MIRSYHLGSVAERPQVVKKHEPAPAQPVNLIICANCHQEHEHIALGLCAACYGYQKRHNGAPRPLRFIEQLSKRKKSAKWCMTCGNPEIYVRQRCCACYDYWLYHRKARPRWLWDDDVCCSTCELPKSASGRRSDGRLKFYKGLCLACYLYRKRTGRERPEHLWGKGSKGWCSCGYPAEHQRDGFNLCNRCVKEYR